MKDTQAFPIAVFALIAIAIIETVLAASWNRGYFRSGLVIFRQRISLVGAIPTFPDPEHLEALFKSRWVPSLRFRELSPGELAFREAYFEFHLVSYTPIMHGHLEALPAERVVLVEGRLNSFTLGFVLMPALWMHEFPLFPFLPILVGACGLLYLIQASRYRGVASALLDKEWGKPAV